jgi:uncharacterized damage-inducible protein DinB
MDPLRIYDYLLMTRERIFDAVRPLPPEQYHRRFTIGLKSLSATLTHLMVSEWYYIERLEEKTVPPYEQWPVKYENPPERFEMIEQQWHAQGKRIRGVVAAERDWSRTITWLSFPDDTRGNKRFHITCTAGDLFTQLTLHEVHHRAQIMAMLRELGTAIVEDIDYNALMYDRREFTS